jgi:hypothetical protein
MGERGIKPSTMGKGCDGEMREIKGGSGDGLWWGVVRRLRGSVRWSMVV